MNTDKKVEIFKFLDELFILLLFLFVYMLSCFCIKDQSIVSVQSPIHVS